MKTLKQIKPIFSPFKKSSRPILEHIRVTNSTIEVTDLETFIVLKGNYDLSPGLHSYETFEHNIAIEDDGEYPCFDLNALELETFTLKLKDIERLLPFTSNDVTRLYLNAIAINTGHLVACDGHTLAYEKLPKDNENSYLMPRDSMRHLIRLCKKFKVDSFDVTLNNEYGFVDDDKFTLKFRLIQRDYPKWRCIIPTRYETAFTVSLMPRFNAIKNLLKKHNHAVKIEATKGKLIMSSTEYPDKTWHIGSSPSDLETVFGVNFKYLDRATKGKKTFEINYNNAFAPFKIDNAIVMPLKL